MTAILNILEEERGRLTAEQAIPDSKMETSAAITEGVNGLKSSPTADHPDSVVSATQNTLSENQQQTEYVNAKESETGETLFQDLNSQSLSIEYLEALLPIKVVMEGFIDALLSRKGDLLAILVHDVACEDFMALLKGLVRRNLSFNALELASVDAVRNEMETLVSEAMSQTGARCPTVENNIPTMLAKLREGFAEIERDQQELEHHTTQLQRWDENAASFSDAINKVVNSASTFLESEFFPNLAIPVSEDLKLIQGRIEGINLVQKMISLLPQKIEEMSAGRNKTTQGDFCSSKYLEDSVLGTLKKVSYHNYGLVTEMRQVAEGRRNLFFSLLNKQYFGILDALEDGKRSLIASESEFSSIPDSEELMQRFLNTYDGLIGRLESCLKEFNISPISAERGVNVDYYLHEPFDVQSDEELQSGQVYDLVRKGYEFGEKLYGERNYVISRAQVRVVKN